jgi:energy-coupling factor transport system substrate-specific component
VSQAWLRVGAGLLASVMAAAGVLALGGGLDTRAFLDTISLATVVAIPAGVAVYALVEYLQTGRIESIVRQFDTRTLLLMPVAVALNIVLGTAVASALKVPIYLDSIGTILVAALSGPLAGAATGFLANTVWTYLAPPPFQSPFAAPFALVAVVIGLLAGSFTRWGWLRPRRGASDRELVMAGLVSVGLVAVVAILALAGWSATGEAVRTTSESDDRLLFVLGWVALGLVGAAVVGLGWLLARERDATPAYVIAAGVITGVVAAFIAAPIAAGLFGGVTGSGADFVIAAFRQAGADLRQAVLGQSLISDPVDKIITYFVAYLIIGAMATRNVARFPQGQYLLARTEGASAGTSRPGVDGPAESI